MLLFQLYCTLKSSSAESKWTKMMNTNAVYTESRKPSRKQMYWINTNSHYNTKVKTNIYLPLVPYAFTKKGKYNRNKTIKMINTHYLNDLKNNSSKGNLQIFSQFVYSQQQHVNVSLVTASGTFILLGANNLALSSSSHVTAVCGWSSKNNSTH